MPLFVLGDFINMLQCQANIIQSAQQIALAEGVDIEAEPIARRCSYPLIFQINNKAAHLR